MIKDFGLTKEALKSKIIYIVWADTFPEWATFDVDIAKGKMTELAEKWIEVNPLFEDGTIQQETEWSVKVVSNDKKYCVYINITDVPIIER